MGKAASKLRFLTRPIKNYNVESRAHKIIEQEKPTPAPTYPSLQKMMDEIKNDPDLLNKGKLSEEEIHHLSQVYIKSSGNNAEIKAKKRLPDDRHSHEEYVYGFYEPTKVPAGKVTLRQLNDLLEKYARDPVKFSPDLLAKEYKLDIVTTHNLVEYFRTFQVYVKPKGPEPGRIEQAKFLLAKPFVFDPKEKLKSPR